MGDFWVQTDASGRWRWRLVTGGKVLATSGETFETREAALLSVFVARDQMRRSAVRGSGGDRRPCRARRARLGGRS
jgi:uncharacterized protein YegP (UPF0339 family)